MMNKNMLTAIDDGHGKNTPGKRTPHIPGIGVIQENVFNKAVARYLDLELQRCGIPTLLVAPTDADTPLKQRTDLANTRKAAIYVSIHYNAGGGEGIETYYVKGSAKGKRLAELVHRNVIQGTKQKDRGVKVGNWWVLRKTDMPAILVEYGFMDDPKLIEARRMINVAYQKECARETAKGICAYFGVRYIPEVSPPPNGTIYIVQADAFSDKSKADALVAKLRKAGFTDAFVKVKNQKLAYIIQVGAFGNKTNAVALVQQLKNAGFSNARII